MFAKDIVDYSKMAFDNLILGNFRGTKMINRAVLENLVCLDLIVHNNDLWKYYIVYSYRDVIYKLNHIPTVKELDTLDGLYENYDILEDFYIKQEGRRKSYIKEPYGWTYKINDTKPFTFENVSHETILPFLTANLIILRITDKISAIVFLDSPVPSFPPDINSSSRCDSIKLQVMEEISFFPNDAAQRSRASYSICY